MKLSESFSLYLDCARFLACFAVVVTHFIQFNLVNDRVSSYLPNLGREAVMLFFVLSGYVIAYSVDTQKTSLSDYLIARFARIYSVALPVLLSAFAITYFYSLYSGEVFYQHAKANIYIPFHLLFLGEFWRFSETPMWLAPYWSLSYEFWYYIFFASFCFFSGVKRVLIAIMIGVIIGYKLWLLFPIWLSGVALYHYQDNFVFRKEIARLGWLGSFVLLGLFNYYDLESTLRVLGSHIWPFDSLPLGSADRFLSDYIVMLIVVINFLCAKYAEFMSLIPFKRIIRNIASYTFTLYLVHALVMSVWINTYAHNANSFFDVSFLCFAILLGTVVIGKYTEHKKTSYQSAMKSAYGHIKTKFSLLKSRN